MVTTKIISVEQNETLLASDKYKYKLTKATKCATSVSATSLVGKTIKFTTGGHNKEEGFKYIREIIAIYDEKDAVQLTATKSVVKKSVSADPVKIEVAVSDSMKQYVPQTNGHYINQKFGTISDEEILSTLYGKKGTTINKALLIEGETGCGKTHFVRAFCYKFKIPYMRVNLNGATTPADLIGQYVPSESGFKWVDGVLTRFMKNGGIFVVDEINMAPAEVLALLNPVLDDERKLVLVQKDGEVIHAHNDFFLIATMNLDYEGTKPLNEALRDRFFCLEFGYNLKAEKNLIKKENSKILEVAQKVRTMHEQGELNSPISTRTLLMFQQNIELFGFDFALDVLAQRFEMVERKAIKEVIELVYSNQTDPLASINATANEVD